MEAFRCICIAIMLLSLSLPGLANVRPNTGRVSDFEAGPQKHPHRLVAVGDIHGDLFFNLATLHTANVIDDEGHWDMGDSILVQVGDIMDRGDDCRFILDFYIQLGKEAEEAGGQVIRLLGNHEVMVLEGDYRYVTRGDFAMFGGKNGHRQAFSKNGDYGKMVGSYPMAHAHNETVFVHAGIMPTWAQKGVEEINRLATQAISRQDWDNAILYNEGPVWARDLVYRGAEGKCKQLKQSLEHLSKTEGRPITRMVVGHTPMPEGKIQFFCNKQLVAIDIAISRGMRGGNIGALSLMDDGEGNTVATSLPEKDQGTDFETVGKIEEAIKRKLHMRYAEEGKYTPLDNPYTDVRDEL